MGTRAARLVRQSCGAVYLAAPYLWALGPYPAANDKESTMATIKTVEQFREALDAGPYAWPGGYPVYFLTHDGETLSFKAAQEHADDIADSIREDMRDSWRVVAHDVNWEDEDMTCAHTGAAIESAYGEAH